MDVTRENGHAKTFGNERGIVLLVDDDVQVARDMAWMMNLEGYEVITVRSASAALDEVMRRSFDVVISDLDLPGASGVDVLQAVREQDASVPLVLVTGCPTVDTAIRAVSLGILEYLVKPTSREQLADVLARAVRGRSAAGALAHRRASGISDVASATLARSSRATVPVPAPHDDVGGVEALDLMTASAFPRALRGIVDTDSSPRSTFERAMARLTVELEPIVDVRSRKLLGFAARMFSAEEALGTEAALVAAAEGLGRLDDLRRRVRDLAVKAFASCPGDALLFVDVHAGDLADEDLYSPEPPLARIADRVVLQVRARGLTASDLSARASVLRFVGFRIAVADLDAAAACLSQIAELLPDYVKLDARLVKDLDASVGRHRLVGALVSMCRSLDAVAIAEGVSTAEERDALLSAGCNVLQGAITLRHVRGASRKLAARGDR